MQLEVPAEPEHADAARRAVAAWTTHLGLAQETADDLVLATHEALANAVDHAYSTDSGTVSITAQATDAEVLVVVRDHGRWRPPRPSAWRGQGLRLIRHLAHHVDLHHDDGGTTVRMTWHRA